MATFLITECAGTATFLICVIAAFYTTGSYTTTTTDWVCTSLSIICITMMVFAYIYSSLITAICAFLILVAYLAIWLSDRKSQKPSQLAFALYISILNSLLIGYLTH